MFASDVRTLSAIFRVASLFAVMASFAPKGDDIGPWLTVWSVVIAALGVACLIGWLIGLKDARKSGQE